METINTSYINDLRIDEYYGLMSEGVKFAQLIADAEVRDFISAYEGAVNDLGVYFKTDFAESTQRKAREADFERKSVYQSCLSVASGSYKFPEEGQAEIWAKVWKVFKQKPNPRQMNQVQATGVILKLVSSLREIGDEDLTAIGFKSWVDKLDASNAKFIEADMARHSEHGQREIEVSAKLRKACTDAFGALITAVTYKALRDDKACAKFISDMNDAIEAKRAQLKIRRDRSKKETVKVDQMAVEPEIKKTGSDV